MVVRDVVAGYMKDKQTRFWTVAIAVVFLLMGSWYAYRSHSRSYEQKAQLTFSTGLEALARAKSEKTNVQLWTTAESLFLEGYDSYKRSSYAPYFLLFAADIANEQGNIEKSIEYIERAAALIPKQAPLSLPMQIRLALQRIDAKDEVVREQGLAQLQAFAADEKNPYRAMALYFDGLRSFESGDRESAERVWQPLVSGVKKNSVWGELASAKLAYQL